MFALVDRPVMFPMISLLGFSGGPVVDTRIDMAVGGRVYLDETTIAEASRLFGFAKPAEVARLRARVNDLEEELAAARAKLRQAGDAIAEAVA